MCWAWTAKKELRTLERSLPRPVGTWFWARAYPSFPRVGRDEGCPPTVTSDRVRKPAFGPLPNCSPGVVGVQSSSRHLCSSRINALERGLPALKACGHNVFVQYPLEQVMHGHIKLLATFFVESQPPARAVMIAIIDSEFQHRADTGEAVEHCGDVSGTSRPRGTIRHTRRVILP